MDENSERSLIKSTFDGWNKRGILEFLVVKHSLIDAWQIKNVWNQFQI